MDHGLLRMHEAEYVERVFGAALGIAVIQEEGASVETVLAADIVCSDVMDALELLANPVGNGVLDR